jgi:transposase
LFLPYKLKDSRRHKFNKKHYNKRDWAAYDKSLKARGSLTIWFSKEAVAEWNHKVEGKHKRGRPKTYSDLAIETCCTLGLLNRFKLRQTEGYVESIIGLLKLNLKTPDYTTLSKRAKTLEILEKFFHGQEKPCVLMIDSTGLKVFGEKEWIGEKYKIKARKVWKKLHLVIDDEGTIISSSLTTHDTSDCSQVDGLINSIEKPLDRVIADGAYDQPPTYEAIKKHQRMFNTQDPIKVVIPPNTVFRPSNEADPWPRRNNIDRLEKEGRERWQKKTGYNRRSMVENTMSRYKKIIGNTLQSRTFKNQITETKIAIKILNRMNALGIPKAYPSLKTA